MSAALAQQQAQMAVDESAHEVPAFGVGIEFRPRAKPRSSEQHSRQPGNRPLSTTIAEVDSLETEVRPRAPLAASWCRQASAESFAKLCASAFVFLLQGESPVAKATAPPRRRQMRARITSTEEI